MAIHGVCSAWLGQARVGWGNEENRIARVTPLPQDLGRSRHPNPDGFLAA